MEILYWDNKIQEIQTYTREKAIEELIAAKKLNEKIEVINTYLKRLEM